MVSFVAQVTGKDPSFGFSRDCDKTPESKVFQLENPYFRSSLVSTLTLLNFETNLFV